MSFTQAERTARVLSHARRLRVIAIERSADICLAYFSVHLVVHRAIRDPAVPANEDELKRTMTSWLADALGDGTGASRPQVLPSRPRGDDEPL